MPSMSIGLQQPTKRRTIIIIIFIRFIKTCISSTLIYKKQACNFTKITMTTSVYKNMIYRKLIEDKHVVKLRGTQMVN